MAGENNNPAAAAVVAAAELRPFVHSDLSPCTKAKLLRRRAATSSPPLLPGVSLLRVGMEEDQAGGGGGEAEWTTAGLVDRSLRRSRDASSSSCRLHHGGDWRESRSLFKWLSAASQPLLSVLLLLGAAASRTAVAREVGGSKVLRDGRCSKRTRPARSPRRAA